EVFDLDHAEIATLLKRTEAACRQLLARARENVATERRVLETSPEEHRRLLHAFVRASAAGEVEPLFALLADDATLVVDTGPEGRGFGRIRNAGRPVGGARRIASFLAAVARQRQSPGTPEERVLNGQPAIVMLRDGRPAAAILISVAGGKIRHVFVQA